MGIGRSGIVHMLFFFSKQNFDTLFNTGNKKMNVTEKLIREPIDMPPKK